MSVATRAGEVLADLRVGISHNATSELALFDDPDESSSH